MTRPQATPKLWAEEGDARQVPLASVIPVIPIDKTYTFAVPDEMVNHLTRGQRVRVPLGKSRRLVEGFILDLSQGQWNNSLQYMESIVEPQSWLGDELLTLGRWMAEYYGSPLGQVLASMVPPAVRKQSGFRTVRLIQLAQPIDQISTTARLGQKQRLLLESLSKYDTPIDAADILREAGCSTATLRSAVKRGWVLEQVVKQPADSPNFDEPLQTRTFTLNEEQETAINTIASHLSNHTFRVLLVYGVSGSGKTEVYIESMKRVLSQGQQVIVLVPEIALTTQLVHRFACRFTDVAVIHSGLTGVKRSLTWNAIRSGEKKVIIGTRSAVFAPCPDLGLIVVDEEQEPSYKNQQTPRFHARDVAIKRAQLLNIPILLGSATPSLETWFNCEHKTHYEKLHLSHRIAGLSLPDVEIVDMRDEEKTRPGYHLLSRLLEKRLGETIAGNQQAILLLNRRGYASVLFCPRCKNRVLCHRCHASLVLHQATDQVRCHHCYFSMPVPSTCADPSCNTKLVRFGIGTERLEEEIRRKFPQARLRRVDSDTMLRTDDYESVVRDFEARAFDIMLGTQMIAKGLDFPNVSLVGVISADTGLHHPDFRANERTFQLLTQVAGRAGRAQAGGRVVVQTLMSDLPAIQTARQHDYEAFADVELESRHRLRLPPFARIVRWILSDPAETQAQLAGEQFVKTLREVIETLDCEGADVLGPFPSPLERLRRMYRYDVLLRTISVEQRQTLLQHLRQNRKLRAKVKRQVIDVDPISLL